MRAHLVAVDIREPALTPLLIRAWHAKVKPPKWPCLYTYTHDGVMVSYYAGKSSVICKAVRSYPHALIIFKELQLAALRVGVRIRFTNYRVTSVMAVLDLGIARADRMLQIDTHLLQQHFMVKHDPDTISSVWLHAGPHVWILWLRGRFVLPGLKTLRGARATILASLHVILQACGLVPRASG